MLWHLQQKNIFSMYFKIQKRHSEHLLPLGYFTCQTFLFCQPVPLSKFSSYLDGLSFEESIPFRKITTAIYYCSKNSWFMNILKSHLITQSIYLNDDKEHIQLFSTVCLHLKVHNQNKRIRNILKGSLDPYKYLAQNKHIQDLVDVTS